MKIFVLNCGSSSLKYRMISMPGGEELFGGEVERIGSKTSQSSRIVHREKGVELVRPVSVSSYAEAFAQITETIEKNSDFRPDAIAHRLVQGGMEFPSSKVITESELPLLDKIKDLAPIHNPPVIELIGECRRLHPEVPQVVVLDSAFHSTIPEYAATYPLPKALRLELGLRKFGFHGISHQFVAEEAAEFLHIPINEFNAVSCHLGTGGASLCAIVRGKSVDNSMGFSPMQGLVMSTRCGDLDASAILKMIAYSNGDFEEVNRALNKESGLLGLSGTSSDVRDIISRARATGDERAEIAVDVYTWRIKKYLGAYLTVVGKADAVIFTDTIGETVPYVREAVCTGMEYFGLKIDEWKNNKVSAFPFDIAAESSKVRIVVVRTNEELAIARTAYQLLIKFENKTLNTRKREGSYEEANSPNS